MTSSPLPPPLLVMLWRLRTKQGGGYAHNLTTYLPTRLPTKFARRTNLPKLAHRGFGKNAIFALGYAFLLITIYHFTDYEERE